MRGAGGFVERADHVPADPRDGRDDELGDAVTTLDAKIGFAVVDEHDR